MVYAFVFFVFLACLSLWQFGSSSLFWSSFLGSLYLTSSLFIYSCCQTATQLPFTVPLLKNTPTQVPSSLCISSLSRPQSNPCSTSSRDPCPFLDAGARCWSVFGVFPCFLAIHTNPHIKSCPLCLPRTCPCLICPPTFGPTSTLPLCLRL